MKLEQIQRRLAGYRPTLAESSPARSRAAVALVLYEPTPDPPELLFIERALRKGDPWSGQMAFPGGRWEASDRDLADTAVRETREEVGLDLDAAIARLDDFQGSRAVGRHSVVVTPFVYTISARTPLTPNREVNSTVWVPLPELLDPASRRLYEFGPPEAGGPFESIFYDPYTIWGLTYRILWNFFELLGIDPPEQF